MFFFLSVQLAGGVQHVVQIASRQFAVMVVFIVFGYIEVNGAFAFVGITVLQNLFYQFYLFDDVSRRMRLDARRKHVQRFHGLVVAVDVILRHFHRLELFQTGFFRDFVFAVVGIVLQVAYIGNVAHVAYLVADMREVAEK